MLYTGSFEMRINLPFSYDGVGSDSFCLYQMAAKSTLSDGAEEHSEVLCKLDRCSILLQS